ncbi:MAG TPA: S16 family serine protease [Gaiellaceae bacterium]|nr:S16 family serine protease [Gaiellaceae bacterium]
MKARFSWPGLALVVGAAVLLLAGVLYVAPSDRYILLPDDARALEPLVNVRGEKADGDGGGFYYVAVDIRKASILEEFFPGLNAGATLVPEHVLNPEGVDEKVRRRAELAEMRRSQRYAAAVALQALGLPVKIEPVGARVAQTLRGYPAAAKLRARDLIRALDGSPVTVPDDLSRLLAQRSPGETVSLRVRRQGRVRVLAIETVPNPRNPRVPFLGVELAEPKITLPLAVKFDLGQVGGPSAGLAFALDLLEELGRDVDRGRRVAATGEIRLDGSVRKVGGLKQKTIGARRSDMDLFLVPGENAAEARQYSDGLRIVPVDSFQQALRALATQRGTA